MPSSKGITTQHWLVILSASSTMLALFITFVATASHLRVLSSFPDAKTLRARTTLSSHIPPPSSMENDDVEEEVMTLRKFLMHPDGYHLAMAPAFFGFYAYFGALAALDEEVAPPSHHVGIVLPRMMKTNVASSSEEDEEEEHTNNKTLLKSVAGASAGAMAAVLLSAGVSPRRAAEFASTLGLPQFADPPGVGGVLKGDLFEALMKDFLVQETRVRLRQNDDKRKIVDDDDDDDDDSDEEEHHIGKKLRLEKSVIPVAVTGFDLLKMKGKVLQSGCMARAARASATFPGLFQPVGWWEADNIHDNTKNNDKIITTTTTENNSGIFLPPSLLIDGGITDAHGLVGLSSLMPHEQNKRVVNLVTGSFSTYHPPGPSDMPLGVHAKEVVSVSIMNTPRCGLWAMENGPRAVEAARRAIHATLDTPMTRGVEPGHYVLRVDASGFVPN